MGGSCVGAKYLISGSDFNPGSITTNQVLLSDIHCVALILFLIDLASSPTVF